MKGYFYRINNYDKTKILPKYSPANPSTPTIVEYMAQIGATLVALKDDFHASLNNDFIFFDRSTDQEQINIGVPNYLIIEEDGVDAIFYSKRLWAYFLTDYGVIPNKRIVKLQMTIDGLFLPQYGYVDTSVVSVQYTLNQTIGRSPLYTEVDFSKLPTNTELFTPQYEITADFGTNNESLIANGGGGGWYIVTASGGIFPDDEGSVAPARATNGLFYYIIPAKTLNIHSLTGGNVVAFLNGAPSNTVTLNELSSWEIWSTDSTTRATNKILHVQWVPFLPCAVFNFTTTTSNDSIKDRWLFGAYPVVNLFARTHTYNSHQYAYLMADNIEGYRFRVQLKLPAGYTYGKFLNIVDNADFVPGQVAYKIGNELLNYEIQDYRALAGNLYQQLYLSEKATCAIVGEDDNQILLQLGEIAPVVPNSAYQTFLASKAGSIWAQSAVSLGSAIANLALISSIPATGGATLPLAVAGAVSGVASGSISIASAYKGAKLQADSVKVGNDTLSLNKMNVAQNWSISLGYGYFYNFNYSKTPVAYKSNTATLFSNDLTGIYWLQANKMLFNSNEYTNDERLDALSRLNTGVYL